MGEHRWVVVYDRHHVRYRDAKASIDEAVTALAQGEERGELAAVAIIRPDGVALDPALMWAGIRAKLDEWDEVS